LSPLRRRRRMRPWLISPSVPFPAPPVLIVHQRTTALRAEFDSHGARLPVSGRTGHSNRSRTFEVLPILTKRAGTPGLQSWGRPAADRRRAQSPCRRVSPRNPALDQQGAFEARSRTAARKGRRNQNRSSTITSLPGPGFFDDGRAQRTRQPLRCHWTAFDSDVRVVARLNAQPSQAL